MEYNLQLDSFEGPLDLLIHLIEKNQLDISEISLKKIAQQYLEYLNRMEEMDLEVASEFLMLAAELLQMKTKTLLPGAKKKKAGTRPGPDLVKRLNFYKRVKKTTDLLKSREEKRLMVFERSSDHLLYFLSRYEDKRKQQENPLEGIKLKQMVQAYNRAWVDADVRQKKEEEKKQKVEEIEGETYTITEKMDEILLFSQDEPEGFYFQDVINNLKNRQEKVVTFLALLELIKSKQVRIEQKDQKSEILIKGGEG